MVADTIGTLIQKQDNHNQYHAIQKLMKFKQNQLLKNLVTIDTIE